MFGSKKNYEPPQFDGSSPKVSNFNAPPSFIISEDKTYRAEIDTNLGRMVVDLYAKKAPLTANNFVFLALYHYYDGLTFHRIIPGFVVQGGDPSGNGTGGPGYRFRDELPSEGDYEIGTLAMANAGPNTNGSQFFIVSGPSGVDLPPLYSIFGKVVEGLDVVSALDAKGTPSGKPIEACFMKTVTITVLDN
ncbi:peptidylprolyl isomerase [Ferrithrix thermotolerans DSM 19514]|uniref:Peptidyl-prolyl cis-trans isomerase n=1 Tax=Ferrithrix thermotolerans DSM 19514 TaxID=1121881 RepID=A0A1M4TDV2_9ACTN|nr:peptidylprolyl isomerase [Ferrithrix thermotolerans]SHE42534.1 peptidylprolyl isomerase [Ferrithrix thermotolerans DSM 19514]